MPGELPTPAGPLYRLGRVPRALEWPPLELVGSGRFDDPRQPPHFRVLYAGDRLACFFEKLAPFRPDRSGAVERSITPSWIRSRRVATFLIDDPEHRLRWLDLRSPVTYADFRQRFAQQLETVGYRGFDLMAATSDRRELTQVIALWTHGEGYSGIRYPTRHTPDLSCWAIFEGVRLSEIEDAPITLDDPDLRTVAASWEIPLPVSPT